MSSNLSSLSGAGSSPIANFNSYLGQFQPIVLLLAIPVAQMAIRGIGKLYRDGLGSLALSIPSIRKKYEDKLKVQLLEFQQSPREKWKAFGPAHLKLPEHGMKFAELVELINHYKKVTQEHLHGQQFSGAIYSDSLTQNDVTFLNPKMIEELPHFESLTAKEASELKLLFLMAFEAAYLWNPLHGKEFSVGQFINYQLIQIISNQFGGKQDETAGFVTSGGTESLMTAARAYLNWGKRERGLERSECVIVAPRSIHAALNKAQMDYGFTLISLPTDEEGRISLSLLSEVQAEYGNKIVAFFGSAPSYPKGKIDPIREMGLVAHELGCGMHVDCCLGALIVDNIDGFDAKYLSFKGVTSLSADPHKNGMSPKGVSVLVTNEMATGKNLAFYPMYSTPDWSGGIYGTPTLAGSQSSVAAFAALLSLLKMGKEGFGRMANEIHQTAVKLGSIISDCNGLRLLGKVEVNVVAFQINPAMNYEKGAIYGFTYLLEKRKFTCSNIKDEAAHFCVTGRFVGDKTSLQRFQTAVLESMKELAELNRKKREEGVEFPGDAGIYGQMGAALHPKKDQMKMSKFLENSILGSQGAADAVTLYHLAHANPRLRV